MDESLTAIMDLLRCEEPVTMKTDWFELRQARLHLAPYTYPHFPIAVASVLTPAGMISAGKYGLGVLSLGAGLPGEAISLVSPDEMKFLEDIERLLKRKLPRAAAPESLAESRHSTRPRDARHERSAPHHRPRPQHEPKEHPPAKPQPARPAPHGFDYTKPYEPAPARPAPGTVTAPPAHRKPHRPAAALLGGGPVKREPHK